MARLPVVSGDKIIRMLRRLGYEVIHQRGSHVKLRRHTAIGTHTIIIPRHKEIAKGTESDILKSISLHNQIPKAELIKMMK